MKIISFGDIHMATRQITHLSGELSNADMVLLSGDLTNFGSKQLSIDPRSLGITR